MLWANAARCCAWIATWSGCWKPIGWGMVKHDASASMPTVKMNRADIYRPDGAARKQSHSGYPASVGLRFFGRIFAWITILVVDVMAFGVGMGRIGVFVGLLFAVLSTLWMWFWLPGSAHRAFERGLLDRAARRYRYVGALAFTPTRERAALLSRAGCHVAARRIEVAERLLALVDPAKLDAAERAVWLNNRACAQLEVGSDPHAALALAEEATVLRPDVPPLHHTRGMALLAVGRIDDAITVLDGMRAGGELSPRLEAERCRDLAAAWERKGQAAYAEDYRLRAAALAR